MKKMLLVTNPKADRGDFVRNLYKVVELYTRAGYELVVYPTSKRFLSRNFTSDYS